jgi:hypothetical protein
MLKVFRLSIDEYFNATDENISNVVKVKIVFTTDNTSVVMFQCAIIIYSVV